jgi:2-polyprenyl-3-methyl-5-hydroxy-6-metoxy-1,4-benzoquinol methylase
MSAAFSVCEVCGADRPRFLLSSPKLDGPLVRCRSCGLVYVGERTGDFTFSAADADRSTALAERVAELGIVRPEVEEAERPCHLEADRERLRWLLCYADPGGSLLDVGCSLGTFLEVARESFSVTGLEPDPGTSSQARAAGLRVETATLDTFSPDGTFDLVTMFHVIEHLQSPSRALQRVHELLRPGGVLVVETPCVDSAWFRLTKSRWRQLIPDHYFFFSRATLERLLRQRGFEPLGYTKVGRRATLRFVADRLRRSGAPMSAQLPALLRALHLEEKTVYVTPGDIMSIVARAR